MKEFKYTAEQLDKILKFLNQVEIKGGNSITSMAMVFQELNNGVEVIEMAESEV